MGGIRIPKLFPGESIETVNSDNALSEFEAFEHAVLRSISAATGATAEEISRDYSRVNYSSARAAMLVAWKTLLRRRQDFAVGFATPVYAAWLEEAVDRGYVPLPTGAPDFAEWRAAYAGCRWIGPGRGWIDPVKERQGEVLGMDAGFGTLESVVAEISGADWRDVLQQRAAEVDEFKRLGLKMPDWAAGGPEADAATDERKPRPA
jgi:lambda family phage portal protein